MTLKMGAVALTVANLERSIRFYEQRVGMSLHRREQATAFLGAGTDDLLILTEEPEHTPRRQGDVGLFHYAIRVPSRAALAGVLAHLAQTQTPLQGLSDHLASEAIYLADPDGHGIEIMRDRPRNEWQYQPNGQPAIDTLPMDTDGVLSALEDDAWNGLPVGTDMSHVHLHAQNVSQSVAFYRQIIGLDLVFNYNDYMVFLAADGYHHHLGVRVGRGTYQKNALGLQWYAMHFSDESAVTAIIEQARNANVPVLEENNGFFIQEPSGVKIRLATCP